MPRGKRKTRNERYRADNSDHTNSDDESQETNSIYSNQSENCRSGADEPEYPEDGVQEMESKLAELLDGLSHKSAQTRTNCFEQLKNAFVKKYVPVFVQGRLFTICEGIEKALKRGATNEKCAAAELASLISLQLPDHEEVVVATVEKNLTSALITVANDKSVSAQARSKCCQALGMVGFMTTEALGEALDLMHLLENIFSDSYLKGDGCAPNVTPEQATLHSAALSAWTLLLTNLSSGQLTDLLETKSFPSLEQLAELLESPHLDIRLSAGEALAVIFESGRMDNFDFAKDFALDVAITFQKLATDSHKYRAKKDRKQQRATFRDFLQFIEDDLVPDIQIKFGSEVLILDSWTKRKQYDSMCSVLGPGINIHLSENDLIRDILAIPEKIVNDGPVSNHANSMMRIQKRMMNAAAFKARTLSRAKNRDKRSDF